MLVSCCRRSGVICDEVGVNDGVPSHNVVKLRCDVFRRGSFQVFGLLEESEVVRWVVIALGLKSGWQWLWDSRCLWHSWGRFCSREVGLAMSDNAVGADATFADGPSEMMFIGVA